MTSKRNIRIVLIVAAGAALIMFSLYLPLRQGLLNKRILGFALARVNEALKGSAVAQRMEGNPLKRFVILDIEVRDPQGKAVIKAARTEVSWRLSVTKGLLPRVELDIEDAFVNAKKRNGQWNLGALRKQRLRPGKDKPSDMPRLIVMVSLTSGAAELSYSPERTIHARVPLARARLVTNGPVVDFNLTHFRAAIESPPLGVNHVSATGKATSTGQGWEIKVSSGSMVTASSTLLLDFAKYHTASRKMEAKADSFEIAPDTLALFWPSHPLGIPVRGRASVEGVLDEMDVFFSVRSSAGELEASGKYMHAKRQVVLQGIMEDFSMGEFFSRPFELKGLNGEFQMNYIAASQAGGDTIGAASIPGQRLMAGFDLSSFAYPGIKSFPVKGEVELTGNRFAGSMLSSGKGADMAVYASGEVTGSRPLLVRAFLADLDPARIKQGLPRAGLAGALKFQGSGHSIQELQGSGELLLNRSSIMDLHRLEGELSYSLSHGTLDIKSADVRAGGIAMRGSGRLQPFNKTLPFRLELAAKLANRDAVPRLTGEAVDMESVSISATLEGDRYQWRASGSGSMAGLESAHIRSGVSRFDFSLTGKGGEEVSGKIDLEAKETMLPSARYRHLQVPVFDLEAGIRLLPSRPLSPALDFSIAADSPGQSFQLDSEGRLKYGVEDGRWSLDLASMDLRFIDRDWQLARPARIESLPGKVRVSGIELSNKESGLGVSGVVLGDELDAFISFYNFEIDPWMERVLPGESIQGIASGSIYARGSAGVPEIRSDISVERPRYADTRLDRAEASVRYIPHRLTVSLRGHSEVSGEVLAKGDFPLRLVLSPASIAVLAKEKMDLEVAAPKMSVSIIDRFVPWVEDAAGSVGLLAHIMGTPGSPEWNGDLELEKVSFNVPQWGLSLSGITGQAIFDRNKVHVPAITVQSGQGTASIKGGLDLEGYSVSKMDLILTAREFKAMNTPDTRAVMDADARISGDPSYPRMHGEVTFKDLVYRPPLILSYQGTAWESEDPTIVVKQEEQTGARQTSPWLDRSDMDILINIPDSALLKNSELNIRMGGELTMRKPPGGFFLLFGEMEAKKGWVLFQNKPFQVERGTFTFPAIPAIDPDLDILASYKVPDYTTYIKIGGNLSQPTLEIYSEPPLSQEDVLSVILFGRPASELTEGQDQALKMAGAQLVAEFAAARLGQAFPVDAIFVHAGESPEERGVGFGKYINERLYLFYYHHFGKEQAEEFKLRYELDKEFSVEAGQDEEGQGGLDVFYSKPY